MSQYYNRETITSTQQGETSEDRANTTSHQHQTRIETPGVDTITQSDGLAIETSVTGASTGTSIAEEVSSGRTTTETKGPTTSRSIAAAHEIRTVNSPGESRTIQNEDAIMTVEFVIKIRNLNAR